MTDPICLNKEYFYKQNDHVSFMIVYLYLKINMISCSFIF